MPAKLYHHRRKGRTMTTKKNKTLETYDALSREIRVYAGFMPEHDVAVSQVLKRSPYENDSIVLDMARVMDDLATALRQEQNDATICESFKAQGEENIMHKIDTALERITTILEKMANPMLRVSGNGSIPAEAMPGYTPVEVPDEVEVEGKTFKVEKPVDPVHMRKRAHVMKRARNLLEPFREEFGAMGIEVQLIDTRKGG